MRYVDIGKVQASVIGLGAWQIGTRSWGWGTEFNSHEVSKLLEAAEATGTNFIDTAELYGQGESERQLGYYLTDYFVLASKVSPWHLSESGVYMAANKSLERLRRQYIDLYQIHVPNPFIPLSKTMRGMTKLINDGIIKTVGVSNFSLHRWQLAEQSLGFHVATNQVDYSLIRPKAFKALRPMLDENHVMIAYSPLAMGLLSGKYDETQRPSGSRATQPDFSRKNYQNVVHVLEVVKQVAKAHSATTGQIALAWVISHPNVIAIPGAKSAEQVKQNAAAADVKLSTGEVALLDEVSAEYRPALHIPRPFEVFKWVFSHF
jgi:aryl-alcohol dehydrogenase-like predicted oxidoreductase